MKELFRFLIICMCWFFALMVVFSMSKYNNSDEKVNLKSSDSWRLDYESNENEYNECNNYYVEGFKDGINKCNNYYAEGFKDGIEAKPHPLPYEVKAGETYIIVSFYSAEDMTIVESFIYDTKSSRSTVNEK